MKTFFLCAVLILGFGLLRLPLESRLDAVMRVEHLREEPPEGLSLHEDLGQKGIAALFGGLRPALATYFYFDSISYFVERRWADLTKSYDIVTQVQPRTARYWELAVWHTAWNASSSYRSSDLSEVRKREMWRLYVARGVEFGEKGKKYLPTSARIYHQVAELHKTRDPDPAKAAENYFMAYVMSNRDYYERFFAYELVKRSGREHWEQAFEILRRHYDLGWRYESLLIDLNRLEERLGIPEADRIPDKGGKDMRDDESALPESMRQKRFGTREAKPGDNPVDRAVRKYQYKSGIRFER